MENQENSKSPLENVINENALAADTPSPIQAVIDALATILYNADAKQRFTITIEDDSSTYDVVHEFGPIVDKTLFDFDARKDVRVAKAPARGVMATNTDNSDADVWLWNQLILGVEGYGDPASPMPPNWRDLVDAADKCKALEILLTAERTEVEVKEKAKFKPWGAKPTGSTVILRCYFDNDIVSTTHEAPSITALHTREYKKLTGEIWFAKGARIGKRDTKIPPQLRRKCELYDSLGIASSGYAGRVPAHHKQAVVDALFETEQELAAKN